MSDPVAAIHMKVLACGIGPDGLLYPLPVGASGGTAPPETPRAAVESTAYAASKVLRASAGTFYGASCEISPDPTLPAGTYYVMVIDAATAVNGATPKRTIGFEHLLSTRDYPRFEDDVQAGLAMTTGCVVAFSTTRDVLTLAGAYMWVSGTVNA